MFYNLVEYLRTEFPAETIYNNTRILLATQDSIPDRCVCVQDTGGPEEPWIQDADKGVQIITRDIDDPKARKIAWDIFEKITSRFGLILPAAAVDGTNYPEIQTSQISANQHPSSLGADETGRIMYTTNYLIKYRRA